MAKQNTTVVVVENTEIEVPKTVERALATAATKFARTEAAFSRNLMERVVIMDTLYRAVGILGSEGKPEMSANKVHAALWERVGKSVSTATLERYGLIARLHDKRNFPITAESVAAAYKLYDNDRKAFRALLDESGTLDPAALAEHAETAANSEPGEPPVQQTLAAQVASFAERITKRIKTDEDRDAVLAALADFTKRVKRVKFAAEVVAETIDA